MKVRTKRLLSLFTAVIIAIGTFSVGFSVSATQNMDANFNTGYTLTGNWRDDIVAVANAQYQMTKEDFGYTEAWCANFVCACGIIAGIPNFPRNASCDQLIVELKNWGGVWHDYNSSYVPQKGDIVFFSKYGNTSTDSTHVGIIYQDGFVATNTVKTIEGNTSGVTSSCVNIKNRAVYGSLPIMGYIELTSVGGTTTPTVTYDSLNPDDYTVPSRTVYYTSPMMTGSDVAWVQAVLYQLGYDIAIDGYFGSASDAVVRQFQADYGLTVDGMAGTNTINKLSELWTAMKTHTHSYTELKSDASTHWYACSCGEITDVAAHSYGSWIVTSQPTDTANGEQVRTCSVCGYVQTQLIPATTSNPTTQIVSDGVRKYKPTLDGLLDASYLDSASVILTGNGDNAVTAYMTWYDDCLYICSVVTDDDITSPGESFFNKTSGLTQNIFFGDTVGYNIAYGGWIGTDANGYALWAFDDTSNTTLAKCTDGDITVNKKNVASTKTANGYISEICIPITTEGFFANNYAFDMFIIANDTPATAIYDENGVSSTRAILASSSATLKIIDETASADTDNSADYYTANSGNYILKAPTEMTYSKTLGVDASLDAAYLNSYRQTFTQTQGSNTITMTTYYLWDTNYLYIYADVTDPTVFSQGLWAFGGTHTNNGYTLPGYEINDVAVFRIFTEDASRGARIVANATNTQESGNAYTTAEDGYAIMTDVQATNGIGACDSNATYGTNMVLDTFTADYPASNTQDYYSSRLKSSGDGYVVELRIPHHIDLFTAGTKLLLSTGAFDVQGNLLYGYGETTWTGGLETAVLSDTVPCQHTWVETYEDPTCGVAGNETFVCSVCDEVLATKAVPATEEHVYTGTETTAATCTATGTMTYTCGVCGDTYTETIAMIAHTPTADAAVGATCEGTGLTEGSHCSVCGTVITAQTVVNAIGHNYVGTETTAPTCTEKGVMTYVCANDASHTYTEDIDALGHDYVDHEGKAPSCEEIGWDAYLTCNRCDYTTYVEQGAIGHNYVGTETTAPTCTEKGVMTYVCENDASHTYTEDIDALDHDYVDHEAQAPTCEEIGWDAYLTCNRCDYTTYVEQGAIGHNYVGTETTAPTCTEKGVMTYVCENDANHTYTEDIDATGHSLGATENGVKTCTVCGHVSDLRIGATTVVFESSLTVNLKIRKDVFTAGGYSDPYIVAEKYGKVYTLTEYYEDGKYLVFPFANHPPQTMGDDYTATVYATKDGELVVSDEPLTYSIYDYVAAVWNLSATTDELKSMLADLLYYGYEAQLFKGHNPESPVTDCIGEDILAGYVTTELPELKNNNDSEYVVLDGATAAWQSMNVVLNSAVEMNLYFTLDGNDTTGVSVELRTASGALLETVEADALVYEAENDRYYAKFTSIDAAKMYDLVYATIYRDGTAISNTLQTSIESYAANVDASSDEAAVCEAMMKYGYSALAYSKVG